jgi:AcrR family transcriptional regulator
MVESDMTEIDIGEREAAICEAAVRLFMRYGVKRTGMNDIAEEAGIARQTLYNSFPNKEAVLRATIGLVMARALDEAERDLAGAAGLEAQLDIVFEHLARRPYAMLHASPHAGDVIDGVGAESRAVIAACIARFGALVIRLLAPERQRIEASGLTVERLADAVLNFAAAAKHEARDAAHLDTLLMSLRDMVLRCAT